MGSVQNENKTEVWNRSDKIVRAVLLFVALLMIAFGIANGGMKDVFLKAVNVCTECIGLG